MHITYTTETILTSLIIVSRVWSRPFDVQCEGRWREGDKWFDGCQWCVCQQSGLVCSSLDCSIIASQLPVCRNLGSRWRDGCYFCQCHLNSIECIPDKACLQLLHSNQPEADIMLSGACVQPTDERCICGIDGVPSCTADVIDKNAFPAISVEQKPTLSPSPRLLSKGQVYLHSGFKFVNTRTHEHHPDATGENYGVKEHLVDTNKDVSQHIYNSQRNAGLSNSQESFSQIGGHSVELQDHTDQSGKKTVPDDETASLLVVSTNHCRWGKRWYGGGLRCYCGNDNFITCGDPKFVVSRIDGFRLHLGECEEGHTWEEKDACTTCTCQISGVAFCHRSPSCPLPFLIKTLPKNINAAINFEVGKGAQILHRGNEFTEQNENNLVWSKTADKIVGEPSFGAENGVLTLGDINKETSGFEAPNVNRTSAGNLGFKEDFSLPYYDEEGGSGDSNFQRQTTIRAEDGDMQTHDIRIKAVTNWRTTLTADIYTAQTVTTTDPATYEASSVAAKSSSDNCTPKSVWVEDGCKRCICNNHGKKICNNSRCHRTTVPTDTLTFSARSRPPGRPVQRPPQSAFWNRTGPITTVRPFGVEDCGRFLPGDNYFVGCNMCTCTTSGPMCTARNCS